MSARATAPARSRSASRSRGRSASRRRQLMRRRLGFLAAVVLSVVVVMGVTSPWVDRAVQEIALPLAHADVIREQAADKDLDPALIAGVIYAESRFRDQTSHAGAKGLMQIMPDTAHYIARKSGGTAFELRDLATPQVNISYGSWYLRYLIDRYDGNTTLAVAAYNAGEHNVDTWVERAGGDNSFDPKTDIPFPETRHYVANVLEHRKQYRERYPKELGLD